MPPSLPYEHLRHREAASVVVDAVYATLLDKSRSFAFVERERLDQIFDELAIHVLSGPAEGLAVGRVAAADLIVVPELEFQADSWACRWSIIDPTRADVLDTFTTGLSTNGEAPIIADPFEVARAVHHGLMRSWKAMQASQGWDALGVLFLHNATESNVRLDRYGRVLSEAIQAQEGDGLRVVRFPAVSESRGEQRLSLKGLTHDDGRWSDLADWWIWGRYEEVDWQGKTPDASRVVVTMLLWDGEHAPIEFEVEGTGGDLRGLADRVATETHLRVSQFQRRPAVAGEALADRLIEEARTLQTKNLGGNMNVSPVWLNRWRRTYELLDLARFVAPDNREAHLEWLRSRFRDDLLRMTALHAGTSYANEPRPLFLLRRVDAWASFVDRFGLEGSWPTQWPQQPNITDNRTDVYSVAGMYAHAAIDCVSSTSALNSAHKVAGERWASSAELRAKHSLARAAAELVRDPGRDRGRPIQAILEEWRSLLDEPEVLRAVIEAYAELQIAGELEPTRSFHARLPSMGEAIDDPDWAESLRARLPEPTPRRVSTNTSARPAESAQLPKTIEPRPVDRHRVAVDLGERYHVSPVAGAAWGNAWLVAAGGQDLWARPMPVESFLFYFTGPPERELRRIDKSLSVPNGVVDMARHGSTVWMATGGNGVVRMDLASRDWTRWSPGQRLGLPAETYASIAVNQEGLPVALTGEGVSPPIVALWSGERWAGRVVDTFNNEMAFGRCVAVAEETICVVADWHGSSPFTAIWSPNTETWIDTRALLMNHLERRGHNLRAIRFGRDRFNPFEVVGLADRFAVVHAYGVTALDLNGRPQWTTAFPGGRVAINAAAMVDSERRHAWFLVGHSGEDGTSLYRASDDGKVAMVAEFEGLREPTVIVDAGHQVWVGGITSGQKLFAVPASPSK
ncbi:MAG: hypothetical protein AAGB29_11325 [Planctomycetota bacterium]